MLRANDVFLGPLEPGDSDRFFRWINEREDVLHSAPYRPVSRDAHDAWFQAVQQRSDTAIFSIRLVESERLIGYCQLVDIHAVHRSAELRIRIGEKGLRGQGYGSQALELLLRFGFYDLNLHRIWLHVFAGNDRAYRVYRKLGFTDEGLLREAAFLDGRYESIRLMALLENEYAGRHSPA
jgi:RimJ/RimL family protein N-acetyltransferase